MMMKRSGFCLLALSCLLPAVTAQAATRVAAVVWQTDMKELEDEASYADSDAWCQIAAAEFAIQEYGNHPDMDQTTLDDLESSLQSAVNTQTVYAASIGAGSGHISQGDEDLEAGDNEGSPGDALYYDFAIAHDQDSISPLQYGMLGSAQVENFCIDMQDWIWAEIERLDGAGQ